MPLQQADPRMKMRKMFLALAGLFMATAAFAQADPEAPAQAPVAPPPAEPENVLNLDLSTGGRVVIHLRPDKAPAHVERIKPRSEEHTSELQSLILISYAAITLKKKPTETT